MRAINISNSKARNAQVGFEQKATDKPTIRMQREDGQEYRNMRFLKSTTLTTIDVLEQQFGEDNLMDALLQQDPEVDVEHVGMRLGKVKKIFITDEGKVAYAVRRRQVFYSPEGEQKEVRPYHTTESNINADLPLRWTGKFIPKEKAVRMFAFTKGYQIKHINGLTFDFLYDMAKQLYEQQAVMLMGTGVKGVGPVVMAGGGTPYRAFLEGRIQGDKYMLIMHLTNLELKSIKKDE